MVAALLVVKEPSQQFLFDAAIAFALRPVTEIVIAEGVPE
jgi:hypothetical protein